MHVVNQRFVICYPVVIFIYRNLFIIALLKLRMSRVLVLVDYECCAKQTFCCLFDHGLSRDVRGFQ